MTKHTSNYFRLALEVAAAREAFDAGNLSGLIDALMVTERDGYPLQPWVLDALRDILPVELQERVEATGDFPLSDDILDDLVKYVLPWIAKQSEGRGEYARWINRWKKDLFDYAMWDAVQEGREHPYRSEDPDLFARTRWDFGGFGGIIGEVVKIEELRGLYVSPRQVKDAHNRVQKRIETEPHRYYLGRWAKWAIRRLNLGP